MTTLVGMSHEAYPTDLSDVEWSILAPLLEARTRRGRPRTHARRTMLNAVLYVLRGGVAWRLLPHAYPPWHTVYDQFRRWCRSGIWRTVNDALREQTRALIGRTGSPRMAIIDSQSARTSEVGGERGYDGGKRLCGRKRHLVVDSQGLVLHVCVHPANVHDRRGGEQVLSGLHERFPTVTQLFADMGYRGLGPWLAAHLAWQLIIVQRPRRWAWVGPGQDPPEMPAGFTVLPQRWLVERTFAWLGRNRRLTKDWERLSVTTETWIYLAMSRLMVKRIAKAMT